MPDSTVDDLLDLLRTRPFRADPRAWGDIAVDAVDALLARHDSTGDDADLEAASRLAEAVWHIDELEPLTALRPIIRCLWATQDLSARADVRRWANVRLLEVVLDRSRPRRHPLLASIGGLLAAVRGEVRDDPPTDVEHRLLIRCLRDHMDSLATDADRMRLGWVDVALAFAGASDGPGSAEHEAAVRAYERAVTDRPLAGDVPAHHLWALAANVALRLAAERRPGDVKRLLVAGRRIYESVRDADVPEEVRQYTLNQRFATLSGDDPALLEVQAQEAHALLREDLNPSQRTQAVRALLLILIKTVQRHSSAQTRRSLREFASRVRGVHVPDDDPAVVAALMLAARHETNVAALDEMVEMLRPASDVHIPWTHWIAFGRTLVVRARAGNDAEIAREVLAVADRLASFGDEGAHGALELRTDALTVLARSGDRSAARTLVALSAGRSGNPLLSLLRLDLGTNPPRTVEDLGRALVAQARDQLSPVSEAVDQTDDPDNPDAQQVSVSVADVILFLIADYAGLSARGSFAHLPRSEHGGVDVFAAALEALDDEQERALLAAGAVMDRALDLGDRVALRNLAITSLWGAPAQGSDRMRVTCGRLLLERFAADADDTDLEKAAALLLSESVQDDRKVPHAPLLVSVIDHLHGTRLGRERRRELLGRLQYLLEDIAYGDAFTPQVRLDAARRVMALPFRVWPYFASIAASVTETLTPDLIVGAGDVNDVLHKAQGMTARGAYATALGGDIAGAIEMAERGQGVLAAVALRRDRVSASAAAVRDPVLHRRWESARDELAATMRPDQFGTALFSVNASRGVTDGIPSDPPTRRLDRGEYFRQVSAQSPEVAGPLARFRQAQADLERTTGPLAVEPDVAGLLAHVQAHGTRLCYVIASPWGGVALVLEPSGGLRAVELPTLTEERCLAWSATITGDARWSDPEAKRSASVTRGPGPEPSAAATEEVLAELADSLEDLADLLGRDEVPVQLVQVGHLAALPVTAALQTTREDQPWFELSVAASGRLHVASSIRSDAATGHSDIVAITDARPTLDRSGRVLDKLPNAAAEGRRLTSDHGARHLTGAQATRLEALWAFASPHRSLHFAVHGEVDRDSPEKSCLYLVGPDGRTAPLEAQDIAAMTIDTRLVFLGACWSGGTGQRLPDEAIGFPTLLLQSGAAAVVAPSWPIDDRAAFTFAVAFYTSWITHGQSAGRAMATAMRTTRAKHPDSPTWAAFALYGT